MVTIPTYEAQVGYQPPRYPEIQIDLAPERALQHIGSAIQGLGSDLQAASERDKAEQDQMRRFQFNLGLEKFANHQGMAYEQDLADSAPDGSDFLAKRTENFQKDYAEFRKSITDPKEQAQADLFAENLWGKQHLDAYKTVQKRRGDYYTNTLADETNNAAMQPYGSRDQAVQAWNLINDKIDASGLDPQVKDRLKHQFGDFFSGEVGTKHPDWFPRPQAGGGGQVPASAQSALSYYRSRGLSDPQAYALVSRFLTESNLNTGARGDYREGHPTAFGIGQWRAERFQNLKAFAASRGLPWTDFKTQLDFALHEMQTTHKAVGDKFRAATNIDQAIDATYDYESPKADRAFERGKQLKQLARITGGKDVAGIVGKTGVYPPEPMGEIAPPRDGPFQYMEPQTWDRIQRAGAQADNQAVAAAKLEREQNLNSLLVGLHDGTYGQADIEQARQSWLTDYGDIEKADAALKKYQGDQADIRSVTARMAAGGGVYDSSESSGDRKAIDQIYQNAVPQPQALATGDNKAASTLYAMWNETGIMPKEPKGEILGMVRSQNIANVTTGLSYLDALERARPDAFRREFDDTTEKQLQTFRAMQDYASPQEIAQRISASADPAVRKAQNALKEEIKPTIDKLTYNDVAANFQGWVGRNIPGMGISAPFTPMQQAILLDDYKQLLTEQYAESGNMDQAKREATARLARVWGVSEANGGRLMKNPPEYYYPAVDDAHPHAWMQQQVRDALDSLGLSKQEESVTLGQKGTTTVYPDWGLVADPRTEAEIAAGKPPSYQLWTVGDDGTVHRALDQKGVEQRIVFDPTPARAAFLQQQEGRRQSYIENRQQVSEQLGQIPSVNPNFFGVPGATAVIGAGLGAATRPGYALPVPATGAGLGAGAGGQALVPPMPGNLDTLRAPAGIPDWLQPPPSPGQLDFRPALRKRLPKGGAR